MKKLKAYKKQAGRRGQIMHIDAGRICEVIIVAIYIVKIILH